MRHTHTYATMDVTPRVFDEVKSHLYTAGYGHAIVSDGQSELLVMTGVALQVDDGSCLDGRVKRRDEIARILEMVARDGLPGPRDLDVAIDAILCHSAGLEAA